MGLPPLTDQARSLGQRVRELARRHPVEVSVFVAVFVLVASSLHPATNGGSNGGFEQWINLTNSMFYGQQDFLFTYGPLFWLTGGATTQYSVLTYWTVILFVSAVNAGFWSLLVAACHRARGYVFLAAAYFLFFSDLQQREALLLWPFALVAYFDFSGRRTESLTKKVLLPLGLVVGFLFYVRFMYGVVGLATFSTYLVYRALVRRSLTELAALLAGVLIGYVTVGLLVFHHAASLVTYVRINSQLNLGNSVDMRLDVVESTGVLVAGLLVLLAVTAVLAVRRRSLLLTGAVLVFLFLKLGFGRDDHYLHYFVVPTAAVAFALVLDRSWWGRSAFVGVLAALYFMASTGTFVGAPTQDSLAAATDFSQGYAARMQSVYGDFRLDAATVARIGRGTVDVYPYNNEYAFANRLNYHHRPVFQNYMTLTPSLDAMNRRFFESPDRPRFVLWSMGLAPCAPAGCNPFDDLDRKYTLDEDPLTTSAILLNYHVVLSTKSRAGAPVVLLEQNDGYTPYTSTTVTRSEMEFGRWYPTPAAPATGMLKLQPDFHLTLYGRLKNTLFRGSIVKVRYRLEDGTVREYRLNTLNASSGVLASPLLDDLGFTGSAVQAIEFVTDATRIWNHRFAARWITVPAPEVRTVGATADTVTRLGALAHVGTVTCDGALDGVEGLAPGPGPVVVTSRLHVRGWLAFSSAAGIPADETFLTLTAADGTVFRVSTRSERRPDVAAAFHHPELIDAGFTTAADLTGLHGTYALRLAGRRGAESFQCRQLTATVTVRP